MENQEKVQASLEGRFCFLFHFKCVVSKLNVSFILGHVYISEFDKSPSKDIPPILEDYLKAVAKTGKTVYVKVFI